MFVDFDGNDYGVLINRATNTITIKATYLVNSKNIASFNKRGRDAYNNKSGKSVFVPGGVKSLKQGNSKGYTVNFDLQGQIDNSSRGVKLQTVAADQTGLLNSFESHPSPYVGLEDENGKTSSNSVDLRESRVGTSSTTHEIGHSLGAVHSSEGGALPIQGVNINNALIAEILAGVGIGGNNINRNSQGNLSGAGDGTLLNGSTNQGLENGQVISAARYERIVKRIERREARKKRKEERDKP